MPVEITDEENKRIRKILSEAGKTEDQKRIQLLEEQNQVLVSELAAIKKTLDTNGLGKLVTKINEYYIDLFKGKQDETGKHVLPVQTEIDEYVKDTKATIDTLLSMAGAAKFGKNYFEAKKRYGGLSFHEMAGGFWKNVLHLTTTGSKILIFHALFIIPLIAIVWMFYLVIGDLSNYTDTISFIYNALLLRIFIAGPLTAISWFGLYSIRINRQLYEEYNHKQRVMELYYSFDDEIKNQGTDEQARRLLDIMMETVNNKPSLDLKNDRNQKKKTKQNRSRNQKNNN